MTDLGPVEKLNRRSRSAVRGVIDRVMAPYVDEIATRSSAHRSVTDDGSTSDQLDANVPSDYFHMMLHELRTVELERSRGDYERIVSVGASGRWYFDWVERSLGPVVQHVGVEAFEPEPTDLPAYVRWVPTTADRFDGIENDGVDLVFAGQTAEHLWAEELAGFLLQARRVLRADGILVLDSPNRLVTERLAWSHGGHSVELSADEISELVELAGFDVEAVRGVWRCEFDGNVLELEDRLDEGAVVVRRIVDAAAEPDACFVWWLIARPARPSDDDLLLARSAALYKQHWPARLCRGMWPGPSAEGPRVPAESSIELESLPFMLPEGRIRIGLQTRVGSPSDVADASIEFLLPGAHLVHRLEFAAAAVDDDGIWWELDQPALMFALVMVLRVSASADLRLRMPLAITALS